MTSRFGKAVLLGAVLAILLFLLAPILVLILSALDRKSVV